MRARQVLAVGVAVVALGGCSSGDSDDKAGPAASAAGAESAAPSYAPSGNEANYLRVLRGIDAALADDEQAAIAHAHSICEGIGQGQAMSQLTQGAATQFSVDAQTAQKVVVVARSNFCKQS